MNKKVSKLRTRSFTRLSSHSISFKSVVSNSLRMIFAVFTMLNIRVLKWLRRQKY